MRLEEAVYRRIASAMLATFCLLSAGTAVAASDLSAYVSSIPSSVMSGISSTSDAGYQATAGNWFVRGEHMFGNALHCQADSSFRGREFIYSLGGDRERFVALFLFQTSVAEDARSEVSMRFDSREVSTLVGSVSHGLMRLLVASDASAITALEDMLVGSHELVLTVAAPETKPDSFRIDLAGIKEALADLRGCVAQLASHLAN
jgi:invasion protein IalB